MGLVWAILFSWVTLFLFVEKSGAINGWDSKELTAAVWRLCWVEETSRMHKGVMDPAPYVVMVSMTLIALLDKKLPLSEYMSENNNSFGKPWTEKHGNKEMTGTNLVWIGFGQVITAGCISQPEF
ncbi:hypothetical protein L208DRAFT_1382247 [Tricholoma matsutake]|nr:hypothetical protein L208DRAFT_1382247 [Tricholoma matsutake 945]